MRAAADGAATKNLLQGAILVCFAVPQEAKPFASAVAAQSRIRVVLTGMGAGQAEATLQAVLCHQPPDLVISSGFAGGLRPGLPSGTVLFDVDPADSLTEPFIAAGALPATFHSGGRVATTAQEKQMLWRRTEADAVEMESRAIRELCRGAKLPSATVRVILDTAEENLPLDFNKLMTARQQMNYLKLGLSVLQSPRAIKGLFRLKKQSAFAAQKLAEVLIKAVSSK